MLLYNEGERAACVCPFFLRGCLKIHRRERKGHREGHSVLSPLVNNRRIGRKACPTFRVPFLSCFLDGVVGILKHSLRSPRSRRLRKEMRLIYC